MEFSEAVHKRQSIKTFDPSHKISDAELTTLFDLVNTSPSSFNMQNTRYVVVRDQERKNKLCEMAWNQEQVKDCSAVILVLAKLNAYEDAAAIYNDTPQDVQDMVVPMIHKFYEGNETLSRDEAIRTGSICSQTLMLAAVDMGYATCPMIGFDFKKIPAYLNVPDNFEPIMMITLGKMVGEVRPRSHRWPLNKIVTFESFDGDGLGA